MLNIAAIAPALGLIVKLDELLPVLATTAIFVAIGLVVFAIALLAESGVVIIFYSPASSPSSRQSFAGSGHDFFLTH